MIKHLSLTRSSMLCFAAAAALCVVVAPARAADTLEWQYKHGDKILAGGTSTLATESFVPSNHAPATTVAFAADQKGMTYASECSLGADKKPVTKTKMLQYGSTMSIDRVGANAFQVKFQSREPQSISSVLDEHACTVQMADVHGSNSDQMVALHYGQKLVLALGQDGYSIELVMRRPLAGPNTTE